MLSALLMAFVPGVAAEPVEVGTDLTDLSVPRAGAGVVMGDDGLVYIFGGSNNFGAFSRALDTVVIYNPETGATTFGPAMTAGVVGSATAKGSDGRIYVFGGFNFTVGNVYRGVQIFNPATSTWAAADMSMPADSYMGGAVCGVDGRLFVFGGWTGATGAINYTLIYDPDAVGSKWSYGADIPDPRWGPGVLLVSATRIMVAGGSDSSVPVGTTSFYNPVTNTWSAGGDLNTARHAFGLAMGRNGYAYAVGGTDYWAWPNTASSLSSIERYDFTAGAWEYAGVTLSTARAFVQAVVNSDGFVIAAGGWSGTSTLVTVEAFLPSDVTGIAELAIMSPGDGSTVSGVVEIQIGIKNNVAGSRLMTMELLVDSTLVETQWAGSAWTFLWNTSGLIDGSSHKITAHGFDWDMSIVEDSIVVTVSSQSVEERIAAIELELADVQTALTVQDANATALRAQVTALQAQLTALQTQVNANNASQSAQLDAMLADLQEQITALQDQIDKVKTTSDSGSMWGMVNMILVVIVIVLLVLMFVMGRKGKTPAPPAT